MRCQPKTDHKVYYWTSSQPACLLCAGRSDSAQALCSDCASELPWLLNPCTCCALPLPKGQLRCGACLQRAPAFNRVEAPWLYRFPVDSLITQFKHQADWPLGRTLAGLLIEHLEHAYQQDLPRPNALLPVPLSRPRLRVRGFNQAELLAQWLGAALQLPVQNQWLVRCKHSQAQQQLDRRQRLRNLRGAFALTAQATVAGQHLALIDDVMTTGATATALAQLLRRAGARRVDVYCLARTPK